MYLAAYNYYSLWLFCTFCTLSDPIPPDLNVCKLKNLKTLASQNSKIRKMKYTKIFSVNVYFSEFQTPGELSFHSVFADNSNKKHFVRPPFSPLIVFNDLRDLCWLYPNTIGDEGFSKAKTAAQCVSIPSRKSDYWIKTYTYIHTIVTLKTQNGLLSRYFYCITCIFLRPKTCSNTKKYWV